MVGRRAHRLRRRARHAGGPAPEVPAPVGARGPMIDAAALRAALPARPTRPRRPASGSASRRSLCRPRRRRRRSGDRLRAPSDPQLLQAYLEAREARPRPEHGTQATFTPDPVIFGGATPPLRRRGSSGCRAPRGLPLPRGVDPLAARPCAHRRCDTSLEAALHLDEGLPTPLAGEMVGERSWNCSRPRVARWPRRSGRAPMAAGPAPSYQAIAWTPGRFRRKPTASSRSYRNTAPTPEGGTHEAGLARGADPRPRALTPTGRTRSAAR